MSHRTKDQHGVSYVFTKHQWLLLFLVLTKLDDLVERGIHPGVHIHGVCVNVRFVVNRPAVVVLLDVLVHGHEVSSHETLVAKRPNDDRWMHLVSLNECFRTVYVRLRPVWVVGRPFRGLVPSYKLTLTERQVALLLRKRGIGDTFEPVAFHVCFIDDPETHLVCEVVQSWVVELMRCADGVDVVTLHEKKIFFHELIRYSATKSGMVFMAVDSAENDPLTVDFDQAIFHFDLSKANALGSNLIAGRDHQMVEVWRLSSPLEWVLDLDTEFSHTITLNIRLG